MKKISALLLFIPLLITPSSNGNELSCFNTPSQFYARDFEFKKGMKILSFEHKIGILDDEVFIGRPRIFFNDSILVCDCGHEAIHISFKKGEVQGYCKECAKEKVKNFEKFNSPVKKSLEMNESNKQINNYNKPKG